MSEIIKIDSLTKDYGNGRGVFDENLSIMEGETVGFVGTNGSGKTTTIRSLLGFIHPTSGCCYVEGKESSTHANEIARDIGYVPGEIAFPDLGTGTAFLASQAEFLHLSDMSYANQLVKMLQLDPRANLKRMSKGMKQKTAIVAALMGNPKILILDEPTTGLDPLMRQAFVDIIHMEKEKKKTIFMSTHMFEEVEDTCDRVCLISDGHLIDSVTMKEISERPVQDFKIEFVDKDDYKRFLGTKFKITRTQEDYGQVTIEVPREEVRNLLSELSSYKLRFISEVPYTLSKHFQEVLKEKNNVQ